jgi:hypothetical protein
MAVNAVRRGMDCSDCDTLTALPCGTDELGWRCDNGTLTKISLSGARCKGSLATILRRLDRGNNVDLGVSLLEFKLSACESPLTGTLGNLSSQFPNLTSLDLSLNAIEGTIDGNLPPLLTSLRLVGNRLSGDAPCSALAPVSVGSCQLQAATNDTNCFSSCRADCCESRGGCVTDLLPSNCTLTSPRLPVTVLTMPTAATVADAAIPTTTAKPTTAPNVTSVAAVTTTTTTVTATPPPTTTTQATVATTTSSTTSATSTPVRTIDSTTPRTSATVPSPTTRIATTTTESSSTTGQPTTEASATTTSVEPSDVGTTETERTTTTTSTKVGSTMTDTVAVVRSLAPAADDHNLPMIIGIVAGALCLLLLAVGFGVVWRRKHKENSVATASQVRMETFYDQRERERGTEEFVSAREAGPIEPQPSSRSAIYASVSVPPPNDYARVVNQVVYNSTSMQPDPASSGGGGSSSNDSE